ncbi:glycosyl transferase family [Arthrobacter sp. Hiyo8]|nr:glycosyl transferase family [Arthrobacter sp. Hiyo8]
MVGIVIAVTVGGAAALLWFAIASTGNSAVESRAEGIVLGVWRILYDSVAPQPRVILVAIAFALLLSAGVAVLEQRIANRSRRSAHPRTPLAPKIVMAETRGVYAGPVTVTVLIPAHNEEASLPATIASLLSQSHRPDRVVAVADNCTDATIALAREAGVEVFESVDNTKKKAGALNQALKWLLPGQGDNDVVMVMDADTRLDDGFLEVAVARMSNDRALMAVGGLFYGKRDTELSANSSATNISGIPGKSDDGVAAFLC